MFIHSPNRRLSFRIGNGFEKYTNRCPCAHTHTAQAHCTLSPSYYCFWCRLVVMVSCVGRGRVRCLRKRDSDRKYMYFFSVFEQPTSWTVTTANTQCIETETAIGRECEHCVFSLITYDNLGLGAMHNSIRDRERERASYVWLWLWIYWITYEQHIDSHWFAPYVSVGAKFHYIYFSRTAEAHGTHHRHRRITRQRCLCLWKMNLGELGRVSGWGCVWLNSEWSICFEYWILLVKWSCSDRKQRTIGSCIFFHLQSESNAA